MTESRLQSLEDRIGQLEARRRQDAILAQFHTAEYAAIMARISAWAQLRRYNGGTFRPTMNHAQVDREVQRILSSLTDKAALQQRLFNWP